MFKRRKDEIEYTNVTWQRCTDFRPLEFSMASDSFSLKGGDKKMNCRTSHRALVFHSRIQGGPSRCRLMLLWKDPFEAPASLQRLYAFFLQTVDPAGKQGIEDFFQLPHGRAVPFTMGAERSPQGVHGRATFFLTFEPQPSPLDYWLHHCQSHSAKINCKLVDIFVLFTIHCLFFHDREF